MLYSLDTDALVGLKSKEEEPKQSGLQKFLVRSVVGLVMIGAFGGERSSSSYR